MPCRDILICKSLKASALQLHSESPLAQSVFMLGKMTKSSLISLPLEAEKIWFKYSQMHILPGDNPQSLGRDLDEVAVWNLGSCSKTHGTFWNPQSWGFSFLLSHLPSVFIEFSFTILYPYMLLKIFNFFSHRLHQYRFCNFEVYLHIVSENYTAFLFSYYCPAVSG